MRERRKGEMEGGIEDLVEEEESRWQGGCGREPLKKGEEAEEKVRLGVRGARGVELY